MMIKKRQRIILYVLMMISVILCLSGCTGNRMEADTETTQAETVEEEALYLIVENDTMEQELVLYSYNTGLEHYYEYSFSTQFKDKYGNYASYTEFVPGRAVTIGKRDADGYLTTVQISDQVWEYEKVRRFSVDEERGVFTIADTKYSIRDKYYIFSNGKRTFFPAISENDVLTVVGMDNKILSIIVTTGHGKLSLKNTELFEDSFLQLNNDIFTIIKENMTIEIPEGTYTLKVANDGWGGSTEIEIVRGEITEVDLDTLKGEGKKIGIISFNIDIENVSVYVDYELIDHTQPIQLTYGTHVLQIEADGYTTWKKYLSVNSEKATIVIEMDEDTEESDEDAEESDEDSEESTESTEINE